MAGRGALAALVLLIPRALAAQTPDAGATSPSAAVAPSAAPAIAPDAAPAEGDARAQAAGEAAQRATQDLEARVIELQRELDAMARERASFEDLRRRVDELEAKQTALGRGAPADWTSAGAGRDALQFSRDGIVVRSPGNRFLLRPGLRVQGLFESDLAAAGPADAARPDSATFSLYHAELLFEGHAFSPRFEYRLELDFGETQPAIAKDAFVQWRFVPSFAVRVGQLKVPFGLETLYWNALLELVDVAQAASTFSLGREVGVSVIGRPLGGRLQYQLAATNGPRAPCPAAPTGPQCDAIDLAYAGRVVAAPFGPLPQHEGDLEAQRRPLVSVGVSGAYFLLPTDVRARTNVTNALIDVDRNGYVDNVGVLQGGVDLRALYRGASLQAEWFGRRETPGAGEGDRSYWGAYGQAGYFVLPRHLELVARVGRTDLPLYGATVAERELRGSHTTEAGGGVSAYLHGHDAKLQVDYTHFSTPDAGSAPTVNRIRAAVQLAFY
jgi:hypothetical protein